LPRWLTLTASAIIVFHFVALAAQALAARSGPWLTTAGPTSPLGPRFAFEIHQLSGRSYLRPLHMTNDYHFVSNVPENVAGIPPATYFEVRLKDQAGTVLKTLKFPDDKANYWLRHRQQLLAQGLAMDVQVQPPQGEKVYPGVPPTHQIWSAGEGETVMKLMDVPEPALPRNRPLSRPSEWSVLLAQSYARYLCREHGAASAEVVRHSRNPILPDVLFGVPPQSDAVTDQVCTFGEYRP
jgi:hypothetical protein